MDYETFYVTPDSIARNATVDHRIPVTGRWGRPPTTVSQPTATMVTAPVPAGTSAVYQYPPTYPTAPTTYPPPWGQPGWNMAGWAPPGSMPSYVYPPIGVPPTSNLASILGGFGDLGSLANIAAQIFAAFLPLPAAPTPQDANDSDASVNAAVNSSNLIRYQNALALFARRDQQILTVGSVLKELLKRPGFAVLGG
jgi:hypothetical protein